jgi:Sigma-70 region 2
MTSLEGIRGRRSGCTSSLRVGGVPSHSRTAWDVGLSDRTMDTPPESELLVAARRGDPAAFERLVSRHRRELYAHCYQMLGSVQDAEDCLQESLLGAWRGLASWLRPVKPPGARLCLRSSRESQQGRLAHPRRFGVVGQRQSGCLVPRSWQSSALIDRSVVISLLVALACYLAAAFNVRWVAWAAIRLPVPW